MVNTDLMEEKIKKSGLKKSYIAKSMNITLSGFYKKMLTGRFTTDEAEKFCDITGIESAEEKCLIFFARNVDKNGNMMRITE